MAKSPDEMAAAMVANLKEKTGKTLEQWLAVVAKSTLAKHGEIVTMLKGDHGVGHGYANLIAHKALASDAGSAADSADLVEVQYAGEKAGLRPIYEKILKGVQGFGKDVEVSPKKAYVSLRRSKQFAIVQPSTKTRVDVGINLKGESPTGRLEAAGSFNSMVSHRVRVEDTTQVDKELLGWLKRAYEGA
jgi:predicted transport protein